MNTPETSRPNTIVVGYSPTPRAEAALRHAIAEAQHHSARVVVVNGSTGDRYTDASFASEDDLARVRRQLEDADVVHDVRQPVRGNDGAAEVLATAEEEDADLIVIGLSRRSAVGKLIMGSTAQRILIGAHCDVLAVKQ
jgi:nucleotide-binding universal stress UspA family protein